MDIPPTSTPSNLVDNINEPSANDQDHDQANIMSSTSTNYEFNKTSSGRQQLNSDMEHDDHCTKTPSPIKMDEDRIVKHIMVIGFHHKHGYQVDYCYPPLTPNGPVFSTPSKPITLPPSWKTLPLLCLPDGSHNYNSDTIYFTMPDLCEQEKLDDQRQQTVDSTTQKSDKTSTGEENESKSSNEIKCEGIKTIFGTACYRQIQADKLLNRTDDMTRVAVQKSVCVLSSQPLFGLIRSKLEMITHAYFEELDFSKVRILKLTYDNLNSLLARDSVRENATFLGLSARHLVSHFGCNMLVLFKAMLLEKKILFYKSPVRDLCSTIMSMCSLFTGLLECGGLDYSTCDLQLSPNLLEALKLLPTPVEDACDDDTTAATKEGKVFFSPSKEEVVIISDGANYNSDNMQNVDDLIENLKRKQEEDKRTILDESSLVYESQKKKSDNSDADELEPVISDYEVIHGDNNKNKMCSSEDGMASLEDTVIDDQCAHKLCQMKPEDCGLPLQILTRGSFCLPYLSISYLDLLSDKRVRSFVIGATNFLFKQRREMYDIIVDMEENSIIISDVHLKRCLNLTIEDLRFMDYLSRHVKDSEGSVSKEDQFDPINHDITNWVGGDEWIRYHFRLYTLYLLKSARTQTNVDSFNASFVQAWKQTTNNYRIWDSTGKSFILESLQSRHPFSSAAKGLNFSDMKLKLSYAVSSSEKGRMVNQTLNGIGKWSIWNNLASAGNMAATSVVSSLAGTTSTSNSSPSSVAKFANSSSTEASNDKQSSANVRQETMDQ